MTGHWTKYDRGDNLLFGAFVADILYSNLEEQLTRISILQDRIQNIMWRGFSSTNVSDASTALLYFGLWIFSDGSISTGLIDKPLQ